MFGRLPGMNGDRRVHEAMVETVHNRGGDAPRDLYTAYEQFNREHFDGRLGAPLILIGACSSPRALGDYIGRDVHGLESRIRISERAVRRGLPYARWVLLHEMVHAWCQEQEHDGEHGYRGHGPKFAAKCNQIGARYGFREVAPKNAKGKPDCARWPFNAGAVAESDEAEREEGGDPNGKPEEEPRARCLHCGKKPAKAPPGPGARFCSPRCAWAWVEATTSGLAWCDAHGWQTGAVADMPLDLRGMNLPPQKARPHSPKSCFWGIPHQGEPLINLIELLVKIHLCAIAATIVMGTGGVILKVVRGSGEDGGPEAE